MPITYLKQAPQRPAQENSDLRDYARRLDGWSGDMVLSQDARAAAVARVPQALQDDIRFAHDNIRRYAQAQMATVQDCTVELLPGHWTGQSQIPVSAAGCYVPGGRYSHVASALMTITTAKVAGVGHITAASPPRVGGLPDAITFAMDLAGADTILTLGGVQAIAAMANGLFDQPAADILVGPGNAYVAEPKRALFGQAGIDMFAGPTDSLVIADHTADPVTVTWDLGPGTLSARLNTGLTAPSGWSPPAALWQTMCWPARPCWPTACRKPMPTPRGWPGQIGPRSSCVTRLRKWHRSPTNMRPSICMCRQRASIGGCPV